MAVTEDEQTSIVSLVEESKETEEIAKTLLSLIEQEPSTVAKLKALRRNLLVQMQSDTR